RNKLAPFDRVAESARQPDKYPAEGKPADERNNSPTPEAGGHRIRRDDAKALMIWSQQQAAEDDCDTDDEKGDQVAENHLPKQRRPIECEEGADAAEAKGRHQADSKGKTRSDYMQALPHGLHRELVKVPADPPSRLAKQPLDAKAQSHECGEVQQDFDSPTIAEIRADAGGAAFDLVGQIGDPRGARADLAADPP